MKIHKDMNCKVGVANTLPLQDKYKEILVLADMLDELEIKYMIRRLYDGWQLTVYNLSIIEHLGSYDSDKDLLEIWDGESTPIVMSAANLVKEIKGVT